MAKPWHWTAKLKTIGAKTKSIGANPIGLPKFWHSHDIATQLQWQYVISRGKPKKIRAKPIGFFYFPYSHETATNKPWLYLKTRNHKHPTPKAQSLKPKLFSIKPYTHTTTTIQTLHTFIYYIHIFYII